MQQKFAKNLLDASYCIPTHALVYYKAVASAVSFIIIFFFLVEKSNISWIAVSTTGDSRHEEKWKCSTVYNVRESRQKWSIFKFPDGAHRVESQRTKFICNPRR